MNKYRIEAGTVYEFSKEHNAYICIGVTSQYTKQQLTQMRNILIKEDD